MRSHKSLVKVTNKATPRATRVTCDIEKKGVVTKNSIRAYGL
jgi:hypothetical protein